MVVLKRLAMAKKSPYGLAFTLAVKALRSEPVQARLREAPDAAVRWAQNRRNQRFTNVIDVDEADPGSPGPQPGMVTLPTGGRRRIERVRGSSVERMKGGSLDRRVDQLAAGFATAFPESSGGVPAEVTAALGDLRRALEATAGLPLAKRTRSRLRIAGELDKLEDALIEAVLPR